MMDKMDIGLLWYCVKTTQKRLSNISFMWIISDSVVFRISKVNHLKFNHCQIFLMVNYHKSVGKLYKCGWNEQIEAKRSLTLILSD